VFNLNEALEKEKVVVVVVVWEGKELDGIEV